MSQSPDLRCRECSTWTPRTELTHDCCPRCVARFEELGMWCAEHGARWPEGCLGCATPTNALPGAAPAEATPSTAGGAARSHATADSKTPEPGLILATLQAYGLGALLYAGAVLLMGLG